MHMKRVLFKCEDSGMAIAPVTQQLNKNKNEEKHLQYVQGAAKYIKNKKLSCCNPNRRGYQALHLAQG